jgi:hypothetical protein
MHRFYPKIFLSGLLTKLSIARVEDEEYGSMQRDIRHENRMIPLTISKGQEMYRKF